MKSVAVVGSGASAVHFAQTALENGWRVQMFDVGRSPLPSINPEANYADLVDQWTDASRYLLGENFEATTLPGEGGEQRFAGPHRAVFEPLDQVRIRSENFEAHQSFVRGGVAQAWGGGAYTLSGAELEDFPFSLNDLQPAYDAVAARIGITGRDDDMGPHVPTHAHLHEPLPLHPHSAQLLERYEANRDEFHRLGIFVGRARAAVLAQARPQDNRPACTLLGRCQWGCPTAALYTPALTLSMLMGHDRFEYRPGMVVLGFESDASGRVHTLIVVPVGGGNKERIPIERLALGAGTLSSSKIVLDSVYRMGGERWILDGLMDHRQLELPFLSWRMLGRPADEATYQYHQLAMGLVGSPLKNYVHVQLALSTTAQIHPLVQRLSLDVRTSLALMRRVRSALGTAHVQFHDTRRAGSRVSIEQDPRGGTRLLVQYAPAPDELTRIDDGRERVKDALRKLGCFVLPGLHTLHPAGASVQYAGTLPMRSESAPRATSATGRSYDFENVWLVDGSTFPFWPAKGPTFTLMANATRIANADFD